MNKIKNFGFVILLIGAVVYFSNHKKNIKQLDEISAGKNANIEKLENKTVIKKTDLNELASSNNPIKNESLSDQTLTYTIDDGLAVVQGDIVIGKISADTILTSFLGPTKEPSIKLWTTTEMPYYIQPNLLNPERVVQALAYFSNTNIHFVPYVNQEDVIVFEQGRGTCKSYLGRIGGRQPLWISEGCSARKIAHEIMHSLGFIHEQNRDDRDNYINIFWENIDPKFKINF